MNELDSQLDIVGYKYRRDVVCNGACVKTVLPTGEGETFDGWADATGVMSAEEFLQGIAAAFGINRETFSNANEFPVAIRRGQLDGHVCDVCGNSL